MTVDLGSKGKNDRKENPSDLPSHYVVYKSESELLESEEYKELLIHYQNAEWKVCLKMIDDLFSRYPDSKTLRELKEQIIIQQAFYQQSLLKIKAEKRNRIGTFGLTLMMIFAGLAAGLLVYWSFMNRSPETPKDTANTVNVVAETNSLKELEKQARGLLQSGNSEVALQVIKQMQALDSTYPALPELIEQASSLSQIDTAYQEAINLRDHQNLPKALQLLKEIESKVPNYRDVAHQIEVIENRMRIDQLMATAESAYTGEQWQSAITAYEEIFASDPSLAQDEQKNHLFLSYYHQIQSILNVEKPTVEQIDQAQSYYP